MDVKEIKRQFTEVNSAEAISITDVTSHLADWIAARSNILKKEDMDLLVSLGSVLHAVHMEQRWQSSWSAQ